MSDRERLCSSLCDAVRMAVQDLIPAARLLDLDHLCEELEKRIQEYWGPDHGISPAELRATARDTLAAAPKKTRQP